MPWNPKNGIVSDGSGSSRFLSLAEMFWGMFNNNQDALRVEGTFTPGAATVAATVTEGRCDPVDINTPKALAAVQTLVANVTIYARRAARVSNTSQVWWGHSAGNGSQNKRIAVDSYTVISAPPGKLIDLATIYIDLETAGDGVEWVAYL